MTYFHFFKIERRMSWWEQIHVANFLQKLPKRKNAMYTFNTIFPYGALVLVLVFKKKKLFFKQMGH